MLCMKMCEGTLEDVFFAPGVGEVGDCRHDGGAVAVGEPGPEVPDEPSQSHLVAQGCTSLE